jgi:pyridoxine 5'-phosphate synthase PdxJ
MNPVGFEDLIDFNSNENSQFSESEDPKAVTFVPEARNQIKSFLFGS